MKNDDTSAIGIIGGSGLYQMEELRDATTRMAFRHACMPAIIDFRPRRTRFAPTRGCEGAAQFCDFVKIL